MSGLILVEARAGAQRDGDRRADQGGRRGRRRAHRLRVVLQDSPQQGDRRLRAAFSDQGEAQDGLGRREPRRAARLPFRRGDQGLGALRFLLRIVSPNDAPIPPEITFQYRTHISYPHSRKTRIYTHSAFCSLLTLNAIDARVARVGSEGEGAHSSRQPPKDQPLPTTKSAVKQASIAHS